MLSFVVKKTTIGEHLRLEAIRLIVSVPSSPCNVLLKDKNLPDNLPMTETVFALVLLIRKLFLTSVATKFPLEMHGKA